MIVAFREPDLTIRTVMKAEDPDEILDLFEGVVFSMFQDVEPDEIFKRIERAAKNSAANG